eukprot:6071213-Prymnesium_polylepis.1
MHHRAAHTERAACRGGVEPRRKVGDGVRATISVMVSSLSRAWLPTSSRSYGMRFGKPTRSQNSRMIERMKQIRPTCRSVTLTVWFALPSAPTTSVLGSGAAGMRIGARVGKREHSVHPPLTRARG